MSEIGRPTKMTEETVKKLEEAFLLGCTDEEACFYADISKQTLYNYQDKYPDFVDRKEALKQNPFFVARTSLINGIKGDPELALKYLERKKKDEFSTRNELVGKDGGSIVVKNELSQLTNDELESIASKAGTSQERISEEKTD